MSSSISKSNGRFKAGAGSPNPRGRPPKKSSRIQTPDDIAELILNVANRPARNGSGDLLAPSVIEHNIMLMAKGQAETRLSPRAFVELCKGAAHRLEITAERKKRDEDELRRREMNR